MKLRIEMEGQPFGQLKNIARTELDLGTFENPSLVDVIELFFNFCYQQGYEFEDVKEAFENVIFTENSEETNEQDIFNFIETKIQSRRDDIEKIVHEKDNRKKFVEQLQSNDEMVKEVFRLFLQDTLGYTSNE